MNKKYELIINSLNVWVDIAFAASARWPDQPNKRCVRLKKRHVFGRAEEPIGKFQIIDPKLYFSSADIIAVKRRCLKNWPEINQTLS